MPTKPATTQTWSETIEEELVEAAIVTVPSIKVIIVIAGRIRRRTCHQRSKATGTNISHKIMLKTASATRMMVNPTMITTTANLIPKMHILTVVDRENNLYTTKEGIIKGMRMTTLLIFMINSSTILKNMMMDIIIMGALVTTLSISKIALVDILPNIRKPTRKTIVDIDNKGTMMNTTRVVPIHQYETGLNQRSIVISMIKKSHMFP